MAPGRCLPGARARGITQLAVWYPVGPSSWPNARRHVSWACASRSSPPALATHIQLIALVRKARHSCNVWVGVEPMKGLAL